MQSPTTYGMYDNTAQKIPFIYVTGIPASDTIVAQGLTLTGLVRTGSLSVLNC